MFTSKSFVSIDEFRTNLAEWLGRVTYGRDRIFIKKYNKEAAVLLSIDEYEKLLDPTKRLKDSDWLDRFKMMDTVRDRINDDEVDLEKLISDSIDEVRS